MPLDRGAKLGPYEIVSRAGAGALGEVYRDRDTPLGHTVRMKARARDLTSDPAAPERLGPRGACSGRTLASAHLPLFDIGHQDGTDFFVMEYLDGETLAARLAR